jgi:hypothetical protein
MKTSLKKRITLLLSLVLIALLLFPAAVFAEGELPPAEDPPAEVPPAEDPVVEEFAVMAAGGQAGTTLTAEVTADPTWEIVYAWEIDKSVDPEFMEMYVGDQGEADYTIVLTKDAGTESAYVEGYIDVTNGGERTTESLYVEAILQAKDEGEKWQNVPGANYVSKYETDTPELGPGETGSYYYYIVIPSDYWVPLLELRIDTIITILNHSGSLGTPKGPEEKQSFTMPAAPTKVNDTIHVTDTNGMSWTFSESGFVTYKKTFLCGEVGIFEYVNTATIDETGQWDDAKVTVNCLQVTGNTFTIGFWKNHAGLGNGNQADLITPLLPIKLGNMWVNTAAEAVAILSNMGSNGIDKLMAQMLATKLNIANGAPVTPKLTAALAAADAFLMTYDADDWSSLSKAEQKAVLSWMTKFDDFNNGY